MNSGREINKDTNVKQRLKQVWRENRCKFYLAVLMLIVGLLLQVVVIAWDTLDQEWEKVGSPYDIQMEYQATTIFTNIRIKLMKAGFSDDNWLSNYLKEKQKQFYESVKIKVPEDDLVIDFMLFQKYIPYIATDNSNDDLNGRLEEIFYGFNSKKSKIRLVNEESKYDAIGLIVEYFLEIQQPEKFHYRRGFFLSEISQLLTEKNINAYAFVILKSQYFAILYDKLISIYPVWNSSICLDPDYTHLKEELKQSMEFLGRLNVKRAYDKLVLNQSAYIRSFAKQIEKFDERECQTPDNAALEKTN